MEGLDQAAEKYFYSRWSDGSLDIKDDVIADFIAGAEWQKAKMMEKAVDGVAEELYNDGDVHCTVGVGTHFKPGDKVIIIPKED